MATRKGSARKRGAAKSATSDNEEYDEGHALRAARKAIKEKSHLPDRLGGPTLADRVRVLEADTKKKLTIRATDNDDGSETVRVWLDEVDDEGKIVEGGDRVSGVGATREEAIANLESKVGGEK